MKFLAVAVDDDPADRPPGVWIRGAVRIYDTRGEQVDTLPYQADSDETAWSAIETVFVGTAYTLVSGWAHTKADSRAMVERGPGG